MEVYRLQNLPVEQYGYLCAQYCNGIHLPMSCTVITTANMHDVNSGVI